MNKEIFDTLNELTDLDIDLVKLISEKFHIPKANAKEFIQEWAFDKFASQREKFTRDYYDDLASLQVNYQENLESLSNWLDNTLIRIDAQPQHPGHTQAANDHRR